MHIVYALKINFYQRDYYDKQYTGINYKIKLYTSLRNPDFAATAL